MLRQSYSIDVCVYRSLKRSSRCCCCTFCSVCNEGTSLKFKNKISSTYFVVAKPRNAMRMRETAMCHCLQFHCLAHGIKYFTDHLPCQWSYKCGHLRGRSSVLRSALMWDFTQRGILQDRRAHLHRCGSLKSQILSQYPPPPL